MDAPRGDAKRPYVTPVLTGYDLFGAEAASGSCCRASSSPSGGSCSTTSRNTLRMRIDGSKNTLNVNS